MKSNDASSARACNDEPPSSNDALRREESRGMDGGGDGGTARKARRRYMSLTASFPVSRSVRTSKELNFVTRDLKEIASLSRANRAI